MLLIFFASKLDINSNTEEIILLGAFLNALNLFATYGFFNIKIKKNIFPKNGKNKLFSVKCCSLARALEIFRLFEAAARGRENTNEKALRVSHVCT